MNQTTEQLRALAVLADAEYSRAKALADRARMSLGLMGMFDPKGMAARARQTTSAATAAHKSAKLAWQRVGKAMSASTPGDHSKQSTEKRA